MIKVCRYLSPDNCSFYCNSKKYFLKWRCGECFIVLSNNEIVSKRQYSHCDLIRQYKITKEMKICEGRLFRWHGYPIFTFWNDPSHEVMINLLEYFKIDSNKCWVVNVNQTVFRGSDYLNQEPKLNYKVPEELRHLLPISIKSRFGSRVKCLRAKKMKLKCSAQIEMLRYEK